ncbi:polarity establishment cellular polarization protein [Rutstroemia sp. NJR-2017a BVV2]|nr:polarity establishment cellular polarization protein [Rutstroemia sp. NJR-2017a BVV2]
MALRIILFVFIIFGAFADAIPTIAYPINSQIPPIARVSVPYSYTFPLSTFTSSSTLSYSLSSAPHWLSLDSDSRTLFGIPLDSDVDGGQVAEVSFAIIASDITGSQTLDVTLVISKNPAPKVEIPVESQLPAFGFFSAPSTSLYHPSSPFNIEFDIDTFSSANKADLTYYASTTDDTPLPSWVLFEKTTLTFSGQTPEYASLIQPPQTFGIQLIASDIPGYAGASISFNIEVGIHLLAFSTTDLVANATPGTEIEYKGLSGSLQLDGKVAGTANIVSVIAKTPDWLAFDNSTLVLSGTPPEDATSYNVSVQALDVYGDTAVTTVLINLSTPFFTGPLPDVNATIGSIFSFDFSDYLANTTDVDLTAQMFPTSSWINFDAHDFILSGRVPVSAEPSTINITISASSKSSNRTSSESFKLAITSSKNRSPTSTSSASSKSISATPAATTNPEVNSSFSDALSKGTIVAIVVPIVVVLIALLICLFCYRRRRQDAKSHSGEPSEEYASGPMGSNSSIVKATYSTRFVPPLQLDTTGFSVLDNSSSVYTSTDPNIAAYNNRKSIRRSQTLSHASPSNFRESQGSATRARAYSENALSTNPHRSTWRNTQETGYPTLDSSSTTNSTQRLARNYSRKGHTRRSTYGIHNEPRMRNSDMSQLGTHGLLDNRGSDGTVLNLTDSNFSSSPIDNFSILSGDWSSAVRASATGRVHKAGQNAERLRVHRKSTTRNLDFIAGPAIIGKRRSVISHRGRESISSFDALNTPGNRRSIGHGQDWMIDQGELPRNSRTWKTVNTFDTDAQKHRSVTSTYSSASTDLLKFGPTTIAPTEGKDLQSIRTVPRSPGPTALIWEKETGRSSRISSGSNSTRPVSRRIGSSPFFAGGTSSVRRKGRRSYADSPTVPEEALIGNELIAAQRKNDSLGITYPDGYNSAKEGTRQLRSYIQATFSKSRLKGSDSMASVDSRFESVSGSMQDLQIGSIPPSQSRHAQLMELDRRETEARERGGYADMLSSEFSAGSWESMSGDSQPNFVRHGASSSIPTLPTASSMDPRGKNNIVTIPEDGHLQVESKSKGAELKDGKESPVMGILGPNARMIMGADRRPISVDVKDNKRISSTKVKMGRYGESSGNVSPSKSDGGRNVEFSAFI